MLRQLSHLGNFLYKVLYFNVFCCHFCGEENVLLIKAMKKEQVSDFIKIETSSNYSM